MLIASFTVATIGALLASRATNPLIFIIAISLVYINTTIYHPASYSFTANLFSSKDRPKALGLHGAGGTLGHAVGPLAVSILIGIMGVAWRNVYLILSVPMMLGIIISFFLKGESVQESKKQETPEEVQEASSLFTFELVMFLIFSALRMVGGSMISTFLVLYLQDMRGLDIAYASFIASSSTLSGLISAPIGGYMAARFGEKKWLLYALGTGYTSLAVSLLFPYVSWFVPFFIIYGFCNTLAMAARSSIMAKLSPSRQRGLGYAIFFLPGSIMGAIAPIIAGFVAATYGFNAIFYLVIAIYALAITIMKFLVKI
jgi:MFS family permease